MVLPKVVFIRDRFDKKSLSLESNEEIIKFANSSMNDLEDIIDDLQQTILEKEQVLDKIRWMIR